jgi:uncharacterized RDD family membrane protein YckC
MTQTESNTVTWRAGVFDTRRLEGVRTRRMLAFLIDYTIVGVLWLVALAPVFLLGILTLGLAWLLYPVLGALIALLYVGTTMSGPRQATWGMSFFSLRIERLDGSRIDFMTAVVHAVLFWAAHIVFTPLLLVVSLFTQKKQLIHDVLLGTVIVRSDR